MKSNTSKFKFISNNIRAERNRKGLTQEEVAKKLSVSTRTYILYETNEVIPKASTLLNLAEIFGCNISDFYAPEKSTKSEFNSTNQE